VQVFRGHKGRLGNVAYHPSGEAIATASFDLTWRLWSVETGQEIMLQDGHFKEVYMCAFHPDGSLIGTGDLSGIGQVWDIRSGKIVFTMQGHVKRIVCGDFSPNGFQVATGGDDHTVRVWDLRQRKCHYTLPAHSHLISDVRYSPGNGEAMLTTSFDGRLRIWGTRDYRLLTDLSGHEGKIMGADFAYANDQKSVAGAFSVGYDRTLKSWGSGLSGYL